jgi:pimeloyl-ACP methyl ester carboxylesterase
MAPYIDLGEVQGYYEVHGTGEPVLLLHGGFCSAENWAAQIEALSAHYEVHVPERPGHGRTPDRPGPITYAGMVADSLTYLDAAGLGSAHVIGFSDGAITGLLLAIDHPERVCSLVSISANLDPSVLEDGNDDAATVTTDAPEDPDDVEIHDAYVRLSPDGPEHAEVILDKLMHMWLSEPDIPVTDLARISAPTLILAGDHDSIPLEHSVTIYRSIPGASMCVVPEAGHLAIRQRPEIVNRALLDFLARVTT